MTAVAGPVKVVALDYSRTLTSADGPRDPTSGMRPVTDEAAEAVRALHGRGLTLLLASNTLTTRRPALECAGIADLFGGLIESHALRAAKPDGRFYRAVLQSAGCAPHEVLFVGANQVCDVTGPMEAGMQAALIGAEPEPGVLPPAAHHLPTIADLPSLVERLCG
ncbi:HAD family hydrolase [Thermomonospora umbrina]|uniref:Haloacid dehalogenase-like hydrolase n=1 Tax=Thermomonospora umbrina TaxID=111806 RepID=A0A3D9TA68_9ACTN|nr:HAD family hydrolase [Thermomonospora umbrina]REF00672.1 haloacid dehalogenase-like hydrolase [Thermomonospora umbrina]